MSNKRQKMHLQVNKKHVLTKWSVSKKSGQTTVVIQYYSLSRFFWKQTLDGACVTLSEELSIYTCYLYMNFILKIIFLYSSFRIHIFCKLYIEFFNKNVFNVQFYLKFSIVLLQPFMSNPQLLKAWLVP